MFLEEKVTERSALLKALSRTVAVLNMHALNECKVGT